MKKLFLLVLFLSCLNCFGQSDTFAIKQNIGGAATLVQNPPYGAFRTAAIIPFTFTDTSAANSANYLKNYSGARVYTTTDGRVWIRNVSKTRWENDALNISGCYTMLNGGVVTWSGSGLAMDVSPATYIINCKTYYSPQSQVTLSAADPSLPRIDVIAVDTNSSVVIVAGTAASNPVKPQVNPNSQLELTSVLVPAGATTPGNITQTVIYDQNTEWTGSASGVTVNFANTSNPFHLTIAADVNTIANGNTITFTNSTDVNTADYSAFKFYMRLKTAFTSSAFLRRIFTIQFFNGATAVTNQISVSDGQYGFSNSTVGSYQTITIPFNSWLFSSLQFDKVQFTFNTSNSSGLYLDWVQLQSGISSGSSIFITDIFRKTGTDSVFYIKNNVQVFAFIDSSGGGGSQGIQSVLDTDNNITSTSSVALNNNNFQISDGAQLDLQANSLVSIIGKGAEIRFRDSVEFDWSASTSKLINLGVNMAKNQQNNDSMLTYNPTTGRMSYKTASSGTSLTGLDTLPYPPWAVAQDVGGTTYKSMPYRVYNVRDYGVVGDGTTDYRSTIQTIINTAHAAGGGIVYFPNGVYYLGTGTGDRGAQLVIPYSDFDDSQNNPTVVLLGETHTPQNYNPLQAGGSNRLPSNKGVVLLSGLPQTDTASVISSLGEGGSVWEAMNFTKVKLENIVVRLNARDAAGAAIGTKDTAINFFNLAMHEVDHVTVDVNCPNDSVASPISTSVGFISASNSNWVKNDYNDFWVIGVYKGAIVYEHANFDNTYFDACYYGLVSPSTNHSIHGNRMGFWRTKIAIKAEAASPYVPAITIDQYNNERYSGARWFTFVADIEETNPGQSTGFIRYNTVSGVFNFVHTNYVGSRISTVSTAGFFPRWATATRPLNGDSALAGLNQTTGHIEYKRIGAASNTWTEIPFISQTANWYTTSTGKWGLGGNPNAATYKLNLYDSAGSQSNMIFMHTTANPIVFMNSSGATAQLSYQFAKSGTVNYQIGMNFNSDATPDFYVYDQVNALAKIYSPNSTSNLYLGANAFTGTGVTILNSGFTGIGNTAPATRLHVGTAGTSLGSISVAGNTSGTISLLPQAAAGTYNWNWPTSAGSSGQPLLSGGGGSTAMTFGTLGVAAGGTGQTSYTDGQLLIGNTGGGNTLTKATLTAGTGVDISNGGGSITISITSSFITQSTYTPTLTNTTNISSSVANSNTVYCRIGDMVIVSGTLTVTPTAELTASELGVSLPIASNFAASTEGGGAGSMINATANRSDVAINMDATNDRALFSFHAPSDSSPITLTFTLSYRITNP